MPNNPEYPAANCNICFFLNIEGQSSDRVAVSDCLPNEISPQAEANRELCSKYHGWAMWEGSRTCMLGYMYVKQRVFLCVHTCGG